jgi:hypothetical protein
LPRSELEEMAVTELKSFEELQNPAKRARKGLVP